MSPLLADSRRVAIYFGGWSLLGCLATWEARWWNGATWGMALAFAVPAALALGLIGTSAYFVCRAKPLAQGRGWRSVGRYALATVTSGGLWAGSCLAWQQSLGGVPLPEGAAPVLWAMGSAVFLVSLLGHDMWLAVLSVQEAQDRVSQAQLEVREAQLQALRMQIQPHFLFNSLNSISALTSIDAAAARDMTLELAQFFRATLELSEKEFLALEEELRLCERFLTIEKIRYGDKLDSVLECSPEAARVMLPPMLIQPLIENAIKHGIRHLPQGGRLWLQALTKDGWLYVTLRNPVPVMPMVSPAPRPGGGTGLRNIAARLRSRYADRARLVAHRVHDEFVVELALPIQERP